MGGSVRRWLIPPVSYTERNITRKAMKGWMERDEQEQPRNMEMVAETLEQVVVQQARSLTTQTANRNVQDSPEKRQRDQIEEALAGQVKEDLGISTEESQKQSSQMWMVTGTDLTKKGS